MPSLVLNDKSDLCFEPWQLNAQWPRAQRMHDAEEQSTDFEIVAGLQDVPIHVQLQRVAEIVAVGKVV